MPKRKRVVRYATDEVQGDGSWALIAKMTVGEMRAARRLVREPDCDAFELGIDILKTHIKGWNWVDDEGEPLPNPKDDPEVVLMLTDEESDLLSNLVQGNEQDAKN